MLSTFSGLRLDALACALPARSRPLEDFIPQFGADKVARFREVAGIDALPTALPGQTTASMAEAAARDLIAAGRLDPQRVGLLLFISQTPEARAPATAALLQHRLGLGEACLALDLNQGCSGFLLGLLTAAHFLQNPALSQVLILGGDTLSRLVDPADTATAMLFGDGAFAALVSRDEAAEPWRFLAATAGSEAIKIPLAAPFSMAGTDVFNFTITRVPEQIQDFLSRTHTTLADFDLLLLHQANAFIVRQIARLLRLPPEKAPCLMSQRGNTSSASLPFLCCDLAPTLPPGPKRLLLSAFGVGLSWLTASLSFDFSNCLPLRRL
ncbi:MAG: 3-oxoacyl-ACP synthase III family protein [Candidatus Spyradenecus sp.]